MIFLNGKMEEKKKRTKGKVALSLRGVSSSGLGAKCLAGVVLAHLNPALSPKALAASSPVTPPCYKLPVVQRDKEDLCQY